jgi:RNA polymerase sigma-70 factor, ECF subfamily
MSRRGSRQPWQACAMPLSAIGDEAVLVERARQRDRAAFEELVRRHAAPLYAVVVRFAGPGGDAEEIVQESFLRAWRGIHRFEGRSEFFTWLYRIAINEAKRAGARSEADQRTIPLEDAPLEDAPDWSTSPETHAQRGDVRAALERCVRALPIDYRAPLILRDVEGFSTGQAAEILELGEAAFKSRLHRARLAVRRAMDEYFREHA